MKMLVKIKFKTKHFCTIKLYKKSNLRKKKLKRKECVSDIENEEKSLYTLETSKRS